ncbi:MULTISPECIES: hypothetical protein [unclassified Microcoleus]|uniref:hypothetical protein n=1 Tax=unclassified Microcoleus TaxID=2642155 RepID=UPI002FD5646C
MHTTEKLANDLTVTPGRINSISKALYKQEKSSFTPEEIQEVAGVVAYMKDRQERSIAKAATAYREGVVSQIRANPREHASQNAIATTGKELGNVSIAQEDLAIARTRAIRRAVGIREAEYDILAQLLDGGFSTADLPDEVAEILEASVSRVYDAGLGKFDAVGGYLPALAAGTGNMPMLAASENYAA